MRNIYACKHIEEVEASGEMAMDDEVRKEEGGAWVLWACVGFGVLMAGIGLGIGM